MAGCLGLYEGGVHCGSMQGNGAAVTCTIVTCCSLHGQIDWCVNTQLPFDTCISGLHPSPLNKQLRVTAAFYKGMHVLNRARLSSSPAATY